MKLKKGDSVLIISGKDKGRSAKILRSFPKERRILIEGLNLRKRHVRPKRQGEKGQVVSVPAPIDASNVKLLCPKCGKAVRLGYKITVSPSNSSGQVKKVRICKKCKSEI